MPESSLFSRRVFLAAGSAIGASLMVPRLPEALPAEGEAHAAEHAHDLAADMAEPWKDFKPGAPFVEPKVRRLVNGELEGAVAGFRILVDGKTFDPDRVDQRVRLGAVEEWTIVNEDQDDQVFHIHTNDMQLTRINGEPLAESIWVDTMIVPGSGSITFRSRIVDFTGKYMLHCHMMNHEELGMMQVVEVYSD